MKKKHFLIPIGIILFVLIGSFTIKRECNEIANGATRNEMQLLVAPGYCKGNYELILTSREPTKLILEELEYLEVLDDSDKSEVKAHTEETISSEEYLLTSEPTVVKVDLKKELYYDLKFPEKQQDDKVDVLVNYTISKISE